MDGLISVTFEALNDLSADADYAIVKHQAMVGCLIVVFAKKSIFSRIKRVASSKVRTGMSGSTGNKGGVAVRFELDGTPIAAANTHLESGQSKLDERIE